MMNWRLHAVRLPLLLLATYPAGSAPLNATPTATDVAADSAYAAEIDGAWKGANPTFGENPAGLDDGGFGFQSWDFAGGFHYPASSPYGRLNHFIDGVDFAHSSFNNLGAPAFGLTNANIAFGGSTARATRTLDSPLTVGSSVSVDFDNPVLQPFNEFVAPSYLIRLNTGGGPVTEPGAVERLGFFATAGFNNDNWSIKDAATTFSDLGLPSIQTTTGATFRFTLTGAESYQLQILPLAGGAALAVKSGSLANPGAGSIDSIEVLIFENGSGNGLPGASALPTGEREFFFNNMVVTGAGQAGDYDADGDVDGADLLVWQRTFGSTVDSAADGNHNGEVDSGDLAIWKMHFGVTGGTHTSVVQVPEPSLMIMALAYTIWLPQRRTSFPRRE